VILKKLACLLNLAPENHASPIGPLENSASPSKIALEKSAVPWKLALEKLAVPLKVDPGKKLLTRTSFYRNLPRQRNLHQKNV
jgi:hypothetical protein